MSLLWKKKRIKAEISVLLVLKVLKASSPIYNLIDTWIRMVRGWGLSSLSRTSSHNHETVGRIFNYFWRLSSFMATNYKLCLQWRSSQALNLMWMTMQISKGNNQGISKIRDFIESAESLGHDQSYGLNIHLHYILSNLSPTWFAQSKVFDISLLDLQQR